MKCKYASVLGFETLTLNFADPVVGVGGGNLVVRNNDNNNDIYKIIIILLLLLLLKYMAPHRRSTACGWRGRRGHQSS